MNLLTGIICIFACKRTAVTEKYLINWSLTFSALLHPLGQELVQIKSATSWESQNRMENWWKKSPKVPLIGLINQHRAKVAHDLSLKAFDTCDVWEKNNTQLMSSCLLSFMSNSWSKAMFRDNILSCTHSINIINIIGGQRRHSVRVVCWQRKKHMFIYLFMWSLANFFYCPKEPFETPQWRANYLKLNIQRLHSNGHSTWMDFGDQASQTKWHRTYSIYRLIQTFPSKLLIQDPLIAADARLRRHSNDQCPRRLTYYAIVSKQLLVRVPIAAADSA